MFVGMSIAYTLFLIRMNYFNLCMYILGMTRAQPEIATAIPRYSEQIPSSVKLAIAVHMVLLPVEI